MYVKETRHQIHEAQRGHVREFLHHEETFDGLVPKRAHPRTQRDIWVMASKRRRADKLGPLMTWACRIMASDPRLVNATNQERVPYFKRVLPNSRAGRHAVAHIEDELRPLPNRFLWPPSVDSSVSGLFRWTRQLGQS